MGHPSRDNQEGDDAVAINQIVSAHASLKVNSCKVIRAGDSEKQFTTERRQRWLLRQQSLRFCGFECVKTYP